MSLDLNITREQLIEQLQGYFGLRSPTIWYLQCFSPTQSKSTIAFLFSFSCRFLMLVCRSVIVQMMQRLFPHLPLQLKSNGTGMAASDERVDYVVVDQQRTQALKSTREAWSDGRQSTETDNPSKGPK